MASKLIHFFNGRARHYERILSLPFFRAFERNEIERILQMVDASGKTVLDIGCGTGRFCRLWGSRGARLVIGMDFSQEMIGIARDKCGPNFLLGDAFNIPFKSGSFDIVSCIGLANYYRDVTPLLEEIMRVGDEFIITFPGASLLGRTYKLISPVEIFLRKKMEVEELLYSHTSDFSLVECASGLTLLIRGRR
jgi:SAM-dependent methyltransferase